MDFVDMNSFENYIKGIEANLYEVIKDSTYAEISKYIEMLPGENKSDSILFGWGFDFLNEYYKVMGKLDKHHSPEMEELKYQIYILYLSENHNPYVLTFEEFITFSRLLNIAFSDYNPDLTRQRDKIPYQSDDEEVDNLVNSIARSVLHSPHPHAYEIARFKLKLLLGVLENKHKAILQEERSKIDLDDPLLTSTLSEKRIRELKEKRHSPLY